VARAIWSGAINFGLVSVPVKLFTAVKPKDIAFHQVDEKTGARIRYKRVSEKTGREVPYEKIAKGYEIGDDKYVVIEPKELEKLTPEATHTIDIEDFVELEQIDPIYYEHTYFLAPDTGEGQRQGRDRPRGHQDEGVPRGDQAVRARAGPRNHVFPRRDRVRR